MEYAAVIIPTLNREKHLRRCVDSLLRNKEAKETDLYISVDFPPMDKYREGYSEVIEYVKTISGFATVNLFFQEKNLGPGLNRKFLENIITEKHDKYIFTDDDNEFSPNFLAYMNWGLEEFKEDETIYSICSCADFDIYKGAGEADFFMISAYNPYGSGHWLHKNKKCTDYLKQETLNNLYKSKQQRNRLNYYSPMIYMWVAQDSLRLISCMRGKGDSLTYIDIWENVYIIENNLKCVKPVCTKSRNWGLDGSGVHVGKDDIKNYVPSVELDNADSWPIQPIRMRSEEEEKNIDRHKKKFGINKKEKYLSGWLYNFNSILGNRCVYGIFKCVRGLYRKITKSKRTEKDEIMYG